MKPLFTMLFIAIAHLGQAQNMVIYGKITSKNQQLPFVKVMLMPGNKITTTDANGSYFFNGLSDQIYTLTTRVVGFEDFQQKINPKGKDSLQVNIDLSQQDKELNTVVVSGTMRETLISDSPVKIEVLSKKFFKNNPVNSVIEALQTVNGVQEQVGCGVCGTNDIHINGMEGPYTLVLIDGMPIVSGLSSVYGFNGIPTSLIERVEIIKGPASTLYGTEAVGGIINIITKKTEDQPLFYTENRYSTHQELNSNIAFSPKIGNRIFTSFSGDVYYNNLRLDENNDGFTDIPLNTRFSLFNKWQFNNKSNKEYLSLGVRYLYEDRFGGVLNWQKQDRGSEEIYGESIFTKRMEVIGSWKLPVKNKNLKLDFSANTHDQDSYYGNTSYSAKQNVFFTNLVWEKRIKKRHQLLGGLTNKYIMYQDNTPSNVTDNNYIPGVFIQDEFSWTEKFIALFGARVDHHERHGFILSPRLSLKYNIDDYTAFRFNYGTGFRQVFLFTEDHAFVSGARDIVIVNELKPEQSHNATFNFNHTYTKWGYGNLDVDLFYTYFSNKITPDFDANPDLIIYDNLDGYGITRGISLAINHSFKVPLRSKIGITFMDVYEMSTNESNGQLERAEQFFAPRYSGVFSLGYTFKKWGLEINYTGNITGPQRLPEFDAPFERPTKSPWYSLQNVQLTKTFIKSNIVEIFGGVKNILNYTQPSPLIDPQNPFGDNFDTSYAYGPLQPRRYYLGLRWQVKRK